MNIRCFLIAAMILFMAGQIAAQKNDAKKDLTFKVGGVKIITPAPSDDFVEVGDDNRSKLEVLAPERNRLISAFLEKADLQNLIDGKDPAMDRYALVEISRGAEYADCSADNFKEVIAEMKNSFGELIAQSFKESEDEINRKLKELDLKDVSLGEAKQLGSFFSKKNAFSFGLMTTVKNGEESKNMIVGGVIVRVKLRLIYLYLFAEYKNEESVKWLGMTVEKWTDEVLKINK